MQKPMLNKTVRMGFRLLLQGRVSLTFDQLQFHYRDVPIKKRINFLIQGIKLMARSVKRPGIPPILQIEPANICNLHCLTCATGAGLLTRPPALMSFDMFRRVIDQVKDHVYLVAFWSWGEPFLNKEAFRMISYAKEQGLLVHTSTNGHFCNTREQAGKVIESGLDSLIVALDGLDQETYEKYRRGGNLQTVIDTIRNIVSERASLGAFNPLITLRFIVMKHNEHQVGQVKKFAEDLGVDAVTFRSAVVRRSAIDFDEKLTPLASKFQRFNHNNEQAGADTNGAKKRISYCHRPYANLTVFSNGDVVACENDFNASLPLGNVARKSIGNILSSGKARVFYKNFRKDLDRAVFCKECENRYMIGHSANVQTHFLNKDYCNNEKTN